MGFTIQHESGKFAPRADHMMIVADVLGAQIYAIGFEMKCFEEHVSDLDKALSTAGRPLDDPQFLDIIKQAFIDLVRQPLDDDMKVRCAETGLWLALNLDGDGDVMRKWISTAYMRFGYCVMTVASNEKNELAVAVGGDYLPLRDYPEMFHDKVEWTPAAADHHVRMQ